MVEATSIGPQSRPKSYAIPFGTILEVISFLESKDIFKGQLFRLDRRLFNSFDQIRKWSIRHLGLIEDFNLERDYMLSLF